MITKQKAIEILYAKEPGSSARGSGEVLIDALDRAGAFPDEATLVEIDACARRILRAGLDHVPRGDAFALAHLCRAAGLVKP